MIHELDGLRLFIYLFFVKIKKGRSTRGKAEEENRRKAYFMLRGLHLILFPSAEGQCAVLLVDLLPPGGVRLHCCAHDTPTGALAAI